VFDIAGSEDYPLISPSKQKDSLSRVSASRRRGSLSRAM
jgi:hypothetical protein